MSLQTRAMRGVLQALGMWKRHWARSDGVAKGGKGAYDTISAWRNGQYFGGCAFSGVFVCNRHKDLGMCPPKEKCCMILFL